MRGKNAEVHAIYERFFKVGQVTSEEELQAAFRLRYQVYCIENAFEDPAHCPNRMETDQFDAHSVHSVVVDRSTDRVIGTVRLILPYFCARTVILPVEHACNHFTREDRDRFRRGRAAEISRFAVSKRFRSDIATSDPQRDGEHLSPLQATSWCQQSFVAMGLLRAIFQMSAQSGITHLYALMEPALLRLISRIGLTFAPLGTLVDYHGARQPCYGGFEALQNQLRWTRPDIWRFISGAGAESIVDGTYDAAVGYG